MSRFDEILQNLNLTDDEMCQQGTDYLKKSGTSEDYRSFADSLVDALTQGSMKYESIDITKNRIFHSLKWTLQSSSWKEKDFYLAFVALHENDISTVVNSLEAFLKTFGTSADEKIDCNEFVYTFVTTFKNAYPGFWTWLSERVSLYNVADDGIAELCAALEHFYYSSNTEKITDSLLGLLIRFPHLYLVDELLGYTYYELRLWKNAIAYYERTIIDENNVHIDCRDAIAFKLGWAYSSLKNYMKAVEYYKEVLRIYPDAPSAKNNLGYCYLQCFRLDDALQVFEECIKDNRDKPYCYNNKVQTLITMGKPQDAYAFAKENTGRGKVGKSMLKQAETAAKRGAPRALVNTADVDVGMADKKSAPLGVPKQQFSSEKTFEDELTMRLERGISTFGKKLSIYDQTGDYYGRQYPIKGGRIDILATDDENNLYAIELKKDGGYGDVYKQMQGYMAWLRENKAKGDQKVYGIICLNNPSEDIIHKVQLDNDIRLIEYSIAYREIH